MMIVGFPSASSDKNPRELVITTFSSNTSQAVLTSENETYLVCEVVLLSLPSAPSTSSSSLILIMLSARLILLSVWLFSARHDCAGTFLDSSIPSASDFFDIPHGAGNLREGLELPSPGNHPSRAPQHLLTGSDSLPTSLDERRGESPHDADVELQSSSLADRLAKQLPEGYSLTPEKIANINGWRHSEGAPLLDQDLAQLSVLESRINEIFHRLRMSNHQDRSQASEINTASHMLRELQRKTKTFSQLTIITLAEPNSHASYLKLAETLLPKTQPLNWLEANKQLQDVADSVLDTWKEFLTRDNLHAELLKLGFSEVDWINTWRYAFRAVDLLHKNGFIHQTKLQSFLKDEGVAKLVMISYVNWLWDNHTLDRQPRSFGSELDDVFNVITDKTNRVLEAPYLESALKFLKLRKISGPRSFEDAVLSGFPRSQSTLNPDHGGPAGMGWDYDHMSRLADVFHDLIPQLTELSSWNPEMRLKMVEGWVENSAKVTALEKDLTKLSRYNGYVDDAFSLMKSPGSESQYPNIYMASDLVQECHRELKTLTEMRLLTLGKSNWNFQQLKLRQSLISILRPPKGIQSGNSPVKSEDELDEVGGVILQKVKKLVTSNDLRAELMGLKSGQRDWFNTCNFAFAAVDSLAGSNFVDPTRISSLLQEEEVSKLVVSHIYLTWWKSGWSTTPHQDRRPLLSKSMLPERLDPQTKRKVEESFGVINTWYSEGSRRRPNRGGPWPKLNYCFKYLDAQTKSTIERSYEEIQQWVNSLDKPRPSCFKELDAMSKIGNDKALAAMGYVRPRRQAS
ncbi:hypothetical protein PSTT_13359 [Puccinia striiformis]|uniref:Uncharacterized protein n=1 Tax=Puccinia striiformis TaxID=27350 RepID=A0A2S4URV4_9BASI|nr:hypothetical protein PSTT_13359 [Puccinia striiformis]